MNKKFRTLIVILSVANFIATACASNPTPSAESIPTAAVPMATTRPTVTVAPTAMVVNVITPVWAPDHRDWLWSDNHDCWAKSYMGEDGKVYCQAPYGDLLLRNPPPVDAYSEADMINIDIVYKWLLGGRRYTDEINSVELVNVDFPFSRKCYEMLNDPSGYFNIQWELYEKIAGWCHTPMTLVDYLYRVQDDYAFLRWNDVNQTVDAVFLVNQWTLPTVSPLSYLSCNQTKEQHGVRIEEIPSSSSVFESQLTVKKMGEILLDRDLFKFEDDSLGKDWSNNVLVYVLDAPLDGDVLIQGGKTTYEYTMVILCPRRN